MRLIKIIKKYLQSNYYLLVKKINDLELNNNLKTYNRQDNVKKLFLLIKICAVLYGAFYVINKLIEKAVWEFKDANVMYIILFIISIHLYQLMYGMRMKLSVLLFNVRIKYNRAVIIHLQSVFYFFFIPLMGMDLARFLKIRIHDINKSKAKFIFWGLITDRLFGIFGAIIIILLSIPFLEISKEIDLIYLTIIGISLTLFVFYIFKNEREKIDSISKKLMLNILDKKILIYLTLNSMLTAFLVSATIFLGAKIFNLPVNLSEILFGSSLAVLASVIPINFLGTGASEIAGIGIYILLGLSVETAVFLVTIGYTSRLIGAVEGVLIEICCTALGFKIKPINDKL
jgi:hypothetical protein